MLSIDIDGMDFWIWEALAIVSPRIVVVEIQELWGPELRAHARMMPTIQRMVLIELHKWALHSQLFASLRGGAVIV